MKVIVFGLFVLAAAASQASAQQSAAHLVAVAGKPVKAGFFLSVNPDCSSIARPTVHIIESPTSGRVEIKASSDFSTFPASNPRSQCNRKSSPSAQVWYVSKMSGTSDSFTVQVISESGFTVTRRYNIEVR